MSCKLNNIVVFLRLLSDLIVLRNFGNIIYDFSRKYDGTVELFEFRKLEKLSIQIRKAESDISYLNSCLQFNLFPNFICFPLPNVGKFDVYAMRRRLVTTAIHRRSKDKRKLVYDMGKIEKKTKQVLSNM